MAPSVKKFKFFPLQVFISSLFLVGNLDHLNWMRHSSCKSSATHFCLYMQYFRGSEQGYGCQCLEFLMCAQIVMHAIARRSCTNTIRVCALDVDSGRKKFPCCSRDSNPRQYCIWLFGMLIWRFFFSLLQQELDPMSVLHLAFWHVNMGKKIPCCTRDSNPHQY